MCAPDKENRLLTSTNNTDSNTTSSVTFFRAHQNCVVCAFLIQNTKTAATTKHFCD